MAAQGSSLFSRREFLKRAGAAGLVVASPAPAKGGEAGDSGRAAAAMGCLVDLARCVGCRSCEAACGEANALPAPQRPYDDAEVLSVLRRPTESAFTVVNRHAVVPRTGGGPAEVFAKVQCMHCVDPACVSACIVGALIKQPGGPVTYDAGKCIGCRYCMVACPFEIPAYEYHDPVAPRVRKCEFCAARLARAGGRPACVEACPMETLTFGPRARLLEEAHTRIGEGRSGQGGQGLYVDHVYGEHEVGGTSWLYLSPVPFASLGFAELPRQAPPRLTEAIQHGTFKLGLGPLGLLSVLGLAMYLLRSRKGGGEETREGGR